MFINLTPHALSLVDLNGVQVDIAPSGTIARVGTKETLQPDVIAGMPVILREMGQVENLPPMQEGKAYLVSGMVLDALRGSGRSDVFAPDTGATAIRNEKSQVIAVTRLVSVG